jgi:hypothetical protein
MVRHEEFTKKIQSILRNKYGAPRRVWEAVYVSEETPGRFKLDGRLMGDEGQTLLYLLFDHGLLDLPTMTLDLRMAQ